MLKRRRTEQDEILEGASARRPAPRRSAETRRGGSVLRLRNLLAAAAAVLILCLLLPLFLSADRLRPTAEAALGRDLGRAVHIGSLKFTLGFGGLAADDVVVADDPSFSAAPFLRAPRVRLGIGRLALLFGRDLEIRAIDLEGPSITLVRDSTDKWNFYALLAADSGTGQSSGPSVRIKRGVINVRTGGGDEPFVLRGVEAASPHLSTAAEFTFSIAATVVGGGSLKLNGKAGPLGWAGGQPVLPMNVLVNARKVAIAESRLTASIAPWLAGRISFDGTLDSDGRTLHANGNIQAAELKLARSAAPSTTPLTLLFTLQHDFASKTGNLTRCDVELTKGSAHLEGKYTESNGKTIVNATFVANGATVAPFAALLPAISIPLPPGVTAQKGVIVLDLHFQGPLDHLSTTGSVNIDNLRLESFDFEDRLSSVTGLDMLHFNRDLELSHWNARITSEDDKLAIDNLEAVLPELGTITGSGAIANDRTLDFQVSAVRSGVSDKRPIPFIVRGATSNPIFRQPGKTN